MSDSNIGFYDLNLSNDSSFDIFIEPITYIMIPKRKVYVDGKLHIVQDMTLLIGDVGLLLQRETNLFMKQQFKEIDYGDKIMAHVKYETRITLSYIEIQFVIFVMKTVLCKRRIFKTNRFCDIDFKKNEKKMEGKQIISSLKVSNR